MGISMGNPNTDGDKFRAMVDFVNHQENFDRCLLCVSDTLAAWNQVDSRGVVLPDAIERSRKLGDEWLVRNSKAIADIRMPIEIVRWDRWRLHPDFAESLAETRFHYERSPGFRTSINADINNIAQRRGPMDAEVAANLQENSLSFLLEEVAGYRLFYREFPACAKMYPGTRLHSFISNVAPPELAQEYFMQLHLKRVRSAEQLQPAVA
jgi:tRNA-dependent cyclodipeptide synthase